MRVFVTGATGWVGSVVVDELLGAGHQVSGLVRSKDKAGPLAAKGATAVEGTLDDLDLLRAEAGRADAVVHTAFNHDFSNFAASAEQDKRAIQGFGEALSGSDKPLLVTSGVALLAPGRLATENDRLPKDAPFPRRSEVTAQDLAGRGIRAATVRLSPSTHGLGGDHGFIAILAKLARDTGVSAYVGEGTNRWAGVHRSDAARLYRLALEEGVSQPVYHAIADEGVPFKQIAEAIGGALGLPVEPRGREHFGWFGEFASTDLAGSSALTREWLGWEPTGPSLLEDIDQPAYYRP
ncbi:MAG: SDR family oxidoreductase [Methylobacterium mesophilicum]|nr:SDR family oxidoreductase [Methylobacterium mesophilicum]